jgi:UDP:flavonoid glycosyltransferase YjiC (YdhE family)
MRTSAQGYVAVIPAYNEAGTIHAVVAQTLKYLDRVVVVDDGSVDHTVECLRELPVTVLRHPRNLGKAAALWRGMQHAVAQGATAVVTLDGDGQHDPGDIPALITLHRRDPSAIVIGARLHAGSAIPWLRYLANRAANFWVSWAAGSHVPDSQSGFRLYPTVVLKAVGSQCDATSGFAFESELLIEAGRIDVPIRTVPVSAIYGPHLRQSHFRKVRDVVRITRMVAGKLLARRLDIPGLLKSRRPATSIPTRSEPYVSSDDSASPRRRRILFIAEAVSLAHVARAAALARALDPERYDVHLACDRRYLHLFETLPVTLHSIRSISSELFQDRLRKGAPLYTTDDLRAYVKQDLRLLADLNPDAVIGDFRLSLSVSARVATIPYLTVTNAHWSPSARPRFVVPELAITQRFGSRLGQALFTVMRPFVFAQHAFALNRVRREYGLASIGYSLPKIFTEADETLYADLPELVPTFGGPQHHHYLGPVLWSPEEAPPWWAAVPPDRPMAYVSLGTSGRPELLSTVVGALHRLGIGALVSTAGRQPPEHLPDNTWTAPYLPGLSAARRADFVICNGGSATVYQAFAAGVPVVGIPTNLDQYLMMDYVQQYGAGEYVRAGEASASILTRITQQIVDNSSYRLRAGRLGAFIAEQPAEKLDQVLRKIFRADRDRAFEIPALPFNASSRYRGSQLARENYTQTLPASGLIMTRKEPSRDRNR